MAARRVYVVWANPLFRDSVLALLRHPDVHCVGIMNRSAIVQEEILSTEPDTILVEKAGGQLSQEVMNLLEQSNFMGRLVSFSLTGNRLHVYHREEWVAVQADDLLRLILS